MLASLHAAGFLPEVWVPDAETERRRRLVARRNQVVRHRTRVKNEIHAILAAHLVPPCPHAELFNGPGRAWLARQVLPDDERAAIERHLRELDRLGEDLAVLDRDDRSGRRRRSGRAAAADHRRDERHGRGRPGRGDRRHPPLLQPAEAGQLLRPQPAGPAVRAWPRPAWPDQQDRPGACPGAAGRGGLGGGQGAGPLARLLRAHPSRRGHQIAAVATARKMAVLVWHLLAKDTDYLWARPALVAHKLRALELQAGRPMKKGNRRGPAYAYNVKTLREPGDGDRRAGRARL